MTGTCGAYDQSLIMKCLISFCCAFCLVEDVILVVFDHAHLVVGLVQDFFLRILEKEQKKKDIHSFFFQWP